jgi:transcriptional regulator with XRE-family HTH domain
MARKPSKGRKKVHRPEAMKTNKERRRPVIADLYCKGWTQREIARELNLSEGRISQELKAMREMWKAEFIEAIDTMKGVEVRRVLHLERTYWAEFDKTCKRKVYPKGEDGKPDYDAPDSEVRVVEVPGDPQLLAGIRGCMELRCKILGLAREDKGDTRVNVFTVESVAAAVVEARKAEEVDRLAEVERLMMDVGEDGIARLSAAAAGVAERGRGGAESGEEHDPPN